MTVHQHLGPNRLPLALAGSLALNTLLWGLMAAGANRVASIPPAHLMEVSRVVIDPKTNVVKPHIVKLPPKPKVKAVEPKETPKPITHEQPKQAPPQRSRVITAPAKTDATKDDKGFVAPPDGNVAPGKVTGQDNGAIKPDPPKTDPPKTDPPKVDPPKVDPPKVDPPKVDPPKADPPAKVDPPKVKGPSKDAEPVNQVSPEIPDSMKSQDLKAFVRVKVEIQEDGSFEVILRTSSGKSEVDDLILNALKKWKWKPALKDGEPVKSTKLFKFEIEVK